MHTNKEWLYTRYVINEKSTTDMAKEAGVSHKTISRWLKKYDIQTRDTQTALDIKYGNQKRSRMQKAMEYYIKSQSRTTRVAQPSLNWNRRDDEC